MSCKNYKYKLKHDMKRYKMFLGISIKSEGIGDFLVLSRSRTTVSSGCRRQELLFPRVKLVQPGPHRRSGGRAVTRLGREVLNAYVLHIFKL